MQYNAKNKTSVNNVVLMLRAALWLVTVFILSCGSTSKSQKAVIDAACEHITCIAGQVCNLGVCHVGCNGGGWTMCGDRCADTSADEEHCGTCATQCSTDQVCSAGTCVASTSVPSPRLIVSLTADDTFENQFTTMAPLLEANGIRATFFVNSSRIDLPVGTFLTTDEIKEMQTVGHEIGSHGLMHLHLLTTLFPSDRIQREVCDSRVDLLARGFDVRSFAYPFGQNDAAITPMPDNVAESSAQRCGYLTARGVGNLSSSSGVFSESIPPADRYMLRAEPSVNSLMSLDQVEQWVLDAETNQNTAVTSPPWLIINFHNICPGAACDPLLAWDTDLFGQFISWLADRKPQGTIVRTISQVMKGPVNPPVPSGTPLIINGDFESYLSGNTSPPDCWLGGGTGNNTAVWTQVAGRTGSGWQLAMSDYTGGSRAIIQDRGTTAIPDYKSCGTPVTPGHSYTFTCWYQSDVPVSLIFYENDNVNHASKKWMTSPTSPASPGAWASISHTAKVPSDFNTVFFGPFITGVCASGCLNGDNTATVIVDDCSAADNG